MNSKSPNLKVHTDVIFQIHFSHIFICRRYTTVTSNDFYIYFLLYDIFIKNTDHFINAFLNCSFVLFVINSISFYFFFYSNVISFLQIILWRRLEMNQNHFLINESSNETKFKINCAFYFYTFLTFDNEHWIWFSDLNLLKNVVVKESSASRFHTAEMHIHSF